MTCAVPHPVRSHEPTGLHPDLDIVGSSSPDCWARCRTCGAWFWITTDNGRFDYSGEWQLDAGLADRAFTKNDVTAAATLLVTTNLPYGLPYGPVWDTPTAALSLYREITPRATDSQRSHALEALAFPSARWRDAARVLREQAARGALRGPELTFAVDAPFPGRAFDDWYELGSSLVLFHERGITRVASHAIRELALPSAPRVLARSGSAVVFSIQGTGSLPTYVIDANGRVSGAPPSETRWKVTALDDEHWLFVEASDAGPVDGRTVRWAEVHETVGVPRLRFRMKTSAGTPGPPRRMGPGWVFGSHVDDGGKEHALTLLDASLSVVARSRGFLGPRLLEPVDADRIWAETTTTPHTLEHWQRRGDILQRGSTALVHTWRRTVHGVVVAPLATGSGLVAYRDDGSVRWKSHRKRDGAVYFAPLAGGEHLLVYDNRTADVVESATGKPAAEQVAIDRAQCKISRDGSVFLKSDVVLWIHAGGASRERIVVGEEFVLETTCGADALLRNHDGLCILVTPQGRVRAKFSAPSARFTVYTTVGGPYLVEPGRVRIAQHGG